MSDPGRPSEVLTIMITDVEGSTALRQIRGDRVTDEILRLHQVIVRGQLRRYRGREHKFLGDGFLLSLRSPVATVRCAVSIQRALERHNAADPEHGCGSASASMSVRSANVTVTCTDRRHTRPPGSRPRRRTVRSSCLVRSGS